MCAGAILFGSVFAAQSQIDSVTRLTASPECYRKVEFVILLQADWNTDPYHSQEIRLDFALKSPSGASVVVPAYFESGRSGRLSVWKARFTPVEIGIYSGEFVLTHSSKQSVSSNVSFTVTHSNQKGFLHVANAWTLKFDNGEPFRGVGENICWESRSRDDSRFFRSLQESPRYNYDYMLGNVAASGGNFFRTWMCPWNLPLEWKRAGNTNRYSNDNSHFNASAIQRMDQLVELSESLDLYMMLTLDNSGDFQGGGWQRNNYNQTNGGPATNSQAFFTDPQAKAQYKDRLRYLVARWGYSPHVAAWEFFNEIDNLMYGLPQRIPDQVVTAWHSEMSDYLKSIDPYRHLVTTSISHREVAGLYNIPSIDFNQIHIYGHEGHSKIQTFPEVFRRFSQQEAKPFVIGEFGFEWDWSKNFDDFATNMDDDFKKGLWLGLFSPTPILPMSWWWEYFDNRGMTSYLIRVRQVLDQMLAAGKGYFADASCRWEGEPMQTVAVRCGQTFFVLLVNDGVSPTRGRLSLPLDAARAYRASAYDPDHDKTDTLADLSPGSATVEGVSIAPKSERILIISPALP
jgi:hypothetical protein